MTSVCQISHSWPFSRAAGATLLPTLAAPQMISLTCVTGLTRPLLKCSPPLRERTTGTFTSMRQPRRPAEEKKVKVQLERAEFSFSSSRVRGGLNGIRKAVKSLELRLPLAGRNAAMLFLAVKRQRSGPCEQIHAEAVMNHSSTRTRGIKTHLSSHTKPRPRLSQSAQLRAGR